MEYKKRNNCFSKLRKDYFRKLLPYKNLQMRSKNYAITTFGSYVRITLQESR